MRAPESSPRLFTLSSVEMFTTGHQREPIFAMIIASDDPRNSTIEPGDRIGRIRRRTDFAGKSLRTFGRRRQCLAFSAESGPRGARSFQAWRRNLFAQGVHP